MRRSLAFLFLTFCLTVLFLLGRHTQNPYVGFDLDTVASRDFTVLKDMEVTVKEQQHHLMKGQILVRRGDVVQEPEFSVMHRLGQVQQKDMVMAASGSVLLALFLLTMFTIYVQRNPFNIFTDTALVNLVTVFYSLGLALMYLVEWKFEYPYVFLWNPIPLVVLLYAVFVNSELAVLMAMILATLMAFTAPVDIRTKLFFVSLLGSLLGVFSVSSRKSRRGDITKAGLLVGVGNFLLLLGLNLTHISQLPEVSFGTIYIEPLLGSANGLLCAMFVLGAIPMIESLFSIPTSTRLLELLELNQPLLQRLMAEAPGTYHHSLIVANMAEKAAEEIGADPLLAKAAALYHDVGKMKRPFFFIENQVGENMHDHLQPSLSVRVITSHTHDGVEIGREYNLPKIILDIMVQHHGTDLVAYFHNKAKQKETEDDRVQEEMYRYDGVKPQTKEAGIIMICDAVEAASRTLLKPSHNAIQALIRRIIESKFAGGQFDECDLTRRDLELIGSSLTRTVVSMYHARIEYPEDILKKARKGHSPVMGREERPLAARS